MALTIENLPDITARVAGVSLRQAGRTLIGLSVILRNSGESSFADFLEQHLEKAGGPDYDGLLDTLDEQRAQHCDALYMQLTRVYGSRALSDIAHRRRPRPLAQAIANDCKARAR